MRTDLALIRPRAPKNVGGGGGGTHRPLPTPPRRGRRGRPGPGRRKWGRALHPSPGFAPPAGATIAGGTPRSCSRARSARASAATERQRDEAGAVARLHAQQHGALAARAGSAKALRTSVGARDPLARDFEDHVAGAEAVRGGGPSGSTCVTTTPSAPAPATLPAGASVRPSLRHIGAAAVALLGGRRVASRCSRGSSPSVSVDGLLRALAA